MKDNRVLHIAIMTAILIAAIVVSCAVVSNYKPPAPIEKPSFGNCCSCEQSVEEIEVV